MFPIQKVILGGNIGKIFIFILRQSVRGQLFLKLFWYIGGGRMHWAKCE